jgi:hydroxymethylbilane synthase
LEGSCKTAIGAHAWFEGAHLKLIVEALAPDGSVRFRHAGEADLTELADPEASARDLGLSLGIAVRDQAGDAIFV